MRFFQTISEKNYGENSYLNDFVFQRSSPSYECWETMRKTCIKLCFAFVTFYWEKGVFLKLLFKILIIFCHWFSEICKKKRKMRFYSCCFKNLKCALMGLRYTLSSILRQQTMPKKPKKCHNIIFQLLISGTCSKRVFTRTQWRMILFG